MNPQNLGQAIAQDLRKMRESSRTQDTKQPIIPLALEDLASKTSTLEDLANNLRNRLAPVLSCGDQPPCGPSLRDAPRVCDLATRIMDVNARLQTITGNLQEMLNNCEL